MSARFGDDCFSAETRQDRQSTRPDRYEVLRRNLRFWNLEESKLGLIELELLRGRWIRGSSGSVASVNPFLWYFGQSTTKAP